MSKQYKPTNTLTDSNSRVTGISINRHGRVVQIRTRIDFPTKAQQAKILYSDRARLNPIPLQ
jgi:hypothetical protein